MSKCSGVISMASKEEKTDEEKKTEDTMVCKYVWFCTARYCPGYIYVLKVVLCV